MRRRRTRSRIRAGLEQGQGWARRALLELPAAARDRLLLEVLAAPSGDHRVVEPHPGAFHAHCIHEAGTAELPPRLLELAAGRLRGTEEGHHCLAVLAELAALGTELPPLPFVRLVEGPEDFYWKLPAIRVLALGGDRERLSLVVEASADVLEDPFDAKDLGEALALGRPEADGFLRELVSDPRPLLRLSAAFALVATEDNPDLVEDRDRETLADLLAFDPDPVVRVHALEVREASAREDPYGVVRRILTDPTLHGFMDSWHWSFAAEELPARDLPLVLRALDESRDAGAAEIAEILGETSHPLAPSLLRSRLFTGSDEDRGAYLKAYEMASLEIDQEILDLFDVEAPPPRVHVLRARAGDEGALPRLLEAIEQGSLGRFDLDPGRDDLLLAALVPEAARHLADASPAVRTRLLRVLRAQLPAEHRPAPDPALLEHQDPDVQREAALDLLERGEPEDLARVRALLDDGGDGRLALLEGLVERSDLARPELVADLLEDPDGHVRRLALRVLTAGKLAGDHRARVAALLEDPDGAVRAEALQACRQAHLPVPDDQLRGLLMDALDDARAEAIRTLATQRGREAVPLLREARAREDVTWVGGLLDEQLGRLARASRDPGASGADRGDPPVGAT